MMLENFKKSLIANKHFNRPLETLPIEKLRKYFEDLKVKGLSQNTIRLHQQIFTQFYDYCLNETDDEKFSILKRKLKRMTVDKEKNPINPADILTPDDIKRLINVATFERDRCI